MSKPSWPGPLENRLYNLLKKLLFGAVRIYAPQMAFNVRRDDAQDDALFARILGEMFANLDSSAPQIKRILNEANLLGRQQFGNLFRAEFGTQAFFNEPWVNGLLNDRSDELIRKLKVSAQEWASRQRELHIEYRKKAGRKGWKLKDVTEKSRKIDATLQGRIAFHTRNTMGNFLADAAVKRAEDFNVEEYEWSTRKDNRVRGKPGGLYPNAKYSHYHREGLVFRYDDPPPDGNPGEPDGCRCQGIPKFPDYGRNPKRIPAWLAFALGALAGSANELSKGAK